MDATAVLDCVLVGHIFFLGSVGDRIVFVVFALVFFVQVKLDPRDQIRLKVGSNISSVRLEKIFFQEKLENSLRFLAYWRSSSMIWNNSNAVSVKFHLFLRVEIEIICPEDDFFPLSAIPWPLGIYFIGSFTFRFNRGFVFNALNFWLRTWIVFVVLSNFLLLDA